MRYKIKTVASIFKETDTVNIVGNAASLFDKGLGTEIDKHPVIRMNTIKSLDAEHQGTRWDYLATSSLQSIFYYNVLKEVPFDTLIFTKWCNGNRDINPHMAFDCNFYKPSEHMIRQLARVTVKPSTGMSLMWLLNSLGVDNVNVFGFDWKATPTYYHDSIIVGPHDYEFEKKWCLDVIEKNGWTLY